MPGQVRGRCERGWGGAAEGLPTPRADPRPPSQMRWTAGHPRGGGLDEKDRCSWKDQSVCGTEGCYGEGRDVSGHPPSPSSYTGEAELQPRGCGGPCLCSVVVPSCWGADTRAQPISSCAVLTNASGRDAGEGAGRSWPCPLLAARHAAFCPPRGSTCGSRFCSAPGTFLALANCVSAFGWACPGRAEVVRPLAVPS